MLYDLECGCGEISEHVMGANDTDLVVECPKCRTQMTRRANRVFSTPYIIGIHGAGMASTNYDGYYDDALDTWITSKRHRKDVMDQKGLVEYEPNPTLKRMSDESKYIMKHSNPGDHEAVAARKTIHNAADKYRRETKVGASLEKAFKDL